MLSNDRSLKGSQSLSAKVALTTVATAFAATGCKTRAFNDAQTQSTVGGRSLSKPVEAQAESLMPSWPIPRNFDDVRALPSVKSLGVSAGTWQALLKDAFTEVGTQSAKPLTLSNPNCAFSVDAWRVSAARLSLYEIDLPGNVTTWQTLALQRETDLSQRIQLHITVQPWCSSERLGRSDFVHTLDHAFLLTFDLSTPFLSEQLRAWLDDVAVKNNKNEIQTIRSENKVLPYARALLALHDGKQGRKNILNEWNQALQTTELLNKKSLPSAAWLATKQALPVNQGFGSRTVNPANLSHPALQTAPAALNGFFSRFLSENNLLRVRAHVTEGLGTSQRFLRWERQNGKVNRIPMQTIAAQWDRTANTITLSPLLSAPQIVSMVGTEQPTSGQWRAQLKDIDLEATPLAIDISVPELLSLGEKIVDPERTSVHSTRCVSCHGLDDALKMAREGRPVAQRGINPAQLSLFGVSLDGRPVINLRTLRAAEADAIRFDEETHDGKRNAQH